MTWPEVLRWLALIAGAAASLAALAWTLGRIFRPWIADVARTEADRAAGKVAAAVADLKANDLPHLEARIERRLAEFREDFGTRLDGIESRLDRMERRADARESRILAAVAARGEEEGNSPDPRHPSEEARGP